MDVFASLPSSPTYCPLRFHSLFPPRRSHHCLRLSPFISRLRQRLNLVYNFHLSIRYVLFWICTTLVFVLSSLGNCPTYLVNKRTDSEAPWTFDVNYINLAASLIYGYAIIVPVVFYFLLKYMGSKADHLKFWGYSLFVFVPTTLTLLIPVEFLRWVIILLAGGASSCFVAMNLRTYLEASNDLTVVVAVTFGLQMVLSIFIKVWFFP